MTTTPTSDLPPVRTDLDAAAGDLAEHGVCRVAGARSDASIATLRDAVFSVAAAEVADGTAWRYDGDGTANQRLWTLLGKGDEFVDLALDETALALVRSVIGQDVLLSNLTANITGPGGEEMFPHSDQQFGGGGLATPLTVTAIWLATDFTVANGATRVVPGSHRIGRPPVPADMVDAVPVCGPAGTLVVLDGRLWHQTGANTTADERRAGVFAFYAQPWLRSQENWPASLDPAVVAAAPPELRALVGYEPYLAVGYIGGAANPGG